MNKNDSFYYLNLLQEIHDLTPKDLDLRNSSLKRLSAFNVVPEKNFFFQYPCYRKRGRNEIYSMMLK